MKKIIVISPSITATHIIKRVTALHQAGFIVEVFAFNRGDGVGGNYPPGVNVTDLGLVPNGKGYVGKFFRATSKLKKIFNLYRNENCMYFACSFDLALITLLFSNKKYIYQISDLVYGYFPTTLIRSFFKTIDKLIIKKSITTVVTSEGFIKYLGSKNIANKFIYQPNNLPKEVLGKNIEISECPTNDHFIFSFIGFVRADSVLLFAKTVGEYFPNYSFHFYGKAMNMTVIDNLIKEYPNIHYFGPYKYPDDLQNIYEKVDLVVSCYDVKSLNVRLAEPNKLFESIYYGKPIIVSSHTFLAEKVNSMGVGFRVDASDMQTIKEFISGLTSTEIKNRINKIKSIPKATMIDDGAIQLLKKIETNFKN